MRLGRRLEAFEKRLTQLHSRIPERCEEPDYSVLSEDELDRLEQLQTKLDEHGEKGLSSEELAELEVIDSKIPLITVYKPRKTPF